VNPNENALTEIQDIFVALDFDQEEFLHIDDQLFHFFIVFSRRFWNLLGVKYSKT